LIAAAVVVVTGAVEFIVVPFSFLGISSSSSSSSNSSSSSSNNISSSNNMGSSSSNTRMQVFSFV